MNICVIGGCHTGNYGIQATEGFVHQWVNQLEVQLGESVEVTVLSMVKLTHISALLRQYNWTFNEADLIILQLGHYELSWRKSFSQLFQAAAHSQSAKGRPKPVYRPKMPKPADALCPISQRERIKNSVKATLLTLYTHTFGQIPYLKEFAHQLTNAFTQLRPYQEKIIIMTPFPSLHDVDQWLRRESHSCISKASAQAGFIVVDTFGAIPKHPAYFLPDGVHLNGAGHREVALRLHELPLRENLLTEQVTNQ